jgi:transglutaminase-like putative cysteine protease
MSLVRRFFLAFLVCGVLSLFCVPQAQANENFDFNLRSSYTVMESGNTVVQQKFTITNKKPTFYVTQYSIEFGSTKLKNVKVFDEKGDLSANVVTTNNKTSIGITFADMIVGAGKSRNFTIQFESADVAIISGNVLEVYIPKLADADKYLQYQVVLQTPVRFGQPARITPASSTAVADNKYVTLTFDKLGIQGVSALFGQKQIFDFQIINNLENPTSNIGVIQISLPPDTSRQKVQYISLEPQPKEITRDDDGNWIATYEIPASKNVDIVLSGKATLSLEPINNLNLKEPGPALTQSERYWESDAPRIQEVAKKYSTPRDIYNYVVGNLSYNYNKLSSKEEVERLGALQALEQPKNAVCQEFTDLFIAMARANNIPARRATGYAYTENNRLRPLSLVEDTLHTWPEYYDATKHDWIPIDPTWGNTTGGINYFDQFDFNHLVFAINGTNSSIPYSAGSYRKERGIKNNISVSFGKETPAPVPTFQIEVNRHSLVDAVLKNQYLLTITNTTGVAWYNIPITLASNNPKVTVSPTSTELEYLLPYQTKIIPFTAQPQHWLATEPFGLTASIQGISSNYELTAGVPIQEVVHSPYFTAGVGTCLVIIALITGCLLVFRRKR